MGQILEAQTTDPGSLTGFPARARTSGNEIVETILENGIMRIFIRRKV